MATVIKERLIDAAPDEVWAALRDFGAVHERLVPGFVVGCTVDGRARDITFFNGATAREVLVGIDDGARRLAYTVVAGALPFTHHHASAQAFPDGDGTRFVWTSDVLPDELGSAVAELMERGIDVIGRTLSPR